MVFAETEIENLWDRFPKARQLDKKFQNYLCCWEHKDDAKIEDTYGGRIPVKKKFNKCFNTNINNMIWTDFYIIKNMFTVYIFTHGTSNKRS